MPKIPVPGRNGGLCYSQKHYTYNHSSNSSGTLKNKQSQHRYLDLVVHELLVKSPA